MMDHVRWIKTSAERATVFLTSFFTPNSLGFVVQASLAAPLLISVLADHFRCFAEPSAASQIGTLPTNPSIHRQSAL